MSVASRRGVAAGRVQGECAVLPVACTMDVAGLARWATCVFARAGWFEDSHDSLWQFLGMVDFWLPFGLEREVLGACIDLAIFELIVRPLVI